MNLGALKRGLRIGLGHLLHYSGAVRIVRAVAPRPGAVILMAHRVRDDEDAFFGGIPPRTFERQIRFLSENYRWLSLSDLVECIHLERPVPPNSVVLTFDDGWRDNYTDALPVLEKYGVPATIYLVTRSLDRGELPWPQRIGYLLQHTTLRELELPPPVDRTFRLRTVEDRKAALAAIKDYRRSLSLQELEAVAETLQSLCGVDLPRDRMLTWEQARKMQTRGIEFGAHTVSHPLMGYLPIDEARHELEQSKMILEERLGRPVRHFAFPGGSCRPDLIELAREIGFRSLYIRDRQRRVNDHLTDAFALTRLGATSDPVPVVATEMAGLYDWGRRMIRGSANRPAR